MVLKKDEWGRLQDQIKGDEVPWQTRRLEEREKLHQLSQQSVSEWTNTIAGQRQQKLQAKAIREQKEEERRVQLDIEEARFQAEKRKEAIQRARALQYAQTDRVKGLQSGVLLAEVLRERDQQRIVKAQREEAIAMQELELHRFTLMSLAEAAKGEEEAQRREREMALRLASSQIEQAAERRHIRVARRQHQLDEQNVLDARAVQFHAQCEAAEEKRRHQAADWKAALTDQGRTKAEIQASGQHLDAEEEARRKAYVASKDRLAELKYRKEMERLAVVERGRDTVISKLEASMDRHELAEEEARQRVQEEKEARERQAEEEKRQRVEVNVTAIRAHHMAERERLQQQRNKLLEDAARERQENEEADREFGDKEKDRTVKQRHQRHATDSDCLDQIDQHRTMRAIASEDAAEEREALLRATAIEEAMFQDFAARELDKARARGCANVVPIARAAAPADPIRKPPTLGETTMRRGPGNPFPGVTKLRMGFTVKH